MMINTQPRQDTVTHAKPVFIRALSSITAQQAVTIVQAVQVTNPGSWDAQITDDYDGYRAILIEPRQPDFQQPCYFISGTAQRLELFEADEEHLMLIGVFDDVESLSAQMPGLLAAPQNSDAQFDTPTGKLLANDAQKALPRDGF